MHVKLIRLKYWLPFGGRHRSGDQPQPAGSYAAREGQTQHIFHLTRCRRRDARQITERVLSAGFEVVYSSTEWEFMNARQGTNTRDPER